MNKFITYNDAWLETLEYFKGDELAAKVFLDKYALKDTNGNLVEKSPVDMHIRLANEFARIEKTKYKNTELTPLDATEIYHYLSNFKYIVPQGSPMYGIGNNYQQVSLSNCFVVSSPKDSYGGIMATDEELVQMSKRRGGVGLDLSNLRPKDATVKNAARTSTGLIPFMERYSNSIREVGQSGRRGALMLSISCHHPEIAAFTTIKNDLTKVTGANISIRLTNEFLNAVENNLEYELRFPVDSTTPIISEMVSARQMWDLIVKNAHQMAEPGLLFWDNIINESLADCYIEEGFKTVSTNPCVVGNTMVLTNLGWMKIKNLEEYKNKYTDLKIITRDSKGELFSSELEWVGITHKNSKLSKIEFNNLEFLLTTPEHKLYTEDFSQIEVKNLKEGDYVIGSNNLLKVEKVSDILHTEDVWDLTANPNYNFYSILNRIESFEEDYVEINDKIKFRYYDIVELDDNVKIFAKDLQVSHKIKDIS